jgi:capsular polysaccharide transport system permease protein
MRIDSEIRTAENFLGALRVQIRVLYALMIREAMTRYGHKDLGFFWLIGDQLILTAGVMMMWSITGAENHADKNHTDVGVVPMALTGYAFLQMWRHIIAHSVQAIGHNSHLLYHQNVKLLDLLLANSLLELIGIVSAFLIAYAPLALYGLIPVARDPLLVFGGFILTAWFSFSFGLIITAMTELNETAARFVQPVMYVTLPFTGIFYLVYWLPDQYQAIVLWSPLVNCAEMIRGGMFPDYITTYSSPLYVVIWCVGLTAVGVPLVQYAQQHSQH